MPAIAAEVLHGGPNTSASDGQFGRERLGSALYLASRESVLGLGRVILYAAIAFGAGLIGFSLTSSLWMACVLLAVAGGGFMMQLAGTNTVLQTIVEERLRGRVMSFYTMAFFGMVPIGSLLGGYVAERLSAPATVRLSGVACIVAAAWFAYRLPAIRALVRPVYQERGILHGAGGRCRGEDTLTPRRAEFNRSLRSRRRVWSPPSRAHGIKELGCPARPFPWCREDPCDVYPCSCSFS
ncbi:MAG: MFS transporter [Vicinamibacterales bacterium]